MDTTTLLISWRAIDGLMSLWHTLVVIYVIVADALVHLCY